MAIDDHVQRNVILYDANDNPISSTLDGSTRRVAVDIGDDILVVVPPGGNIPLDKYRRNFLEDGGNRNMVVNGSGTPVVFEVLADPSDTVSYFEVRFVITTDDISWDNQSFIEKDILSNGCLFEIRSNSVTQTLDNLVQSEDLLNFPESGGGINLYDPSSKNEVFSASWKLPNSPLVAGSGDFIRMTIRDELDDDHIKYLFTAVAHGVAQ